jgi:hypothetical protein
MIDNPAKLADAMLDIIDMPLAKFHARLTEVEKDNLSLRKDNAELKDRIANMLVDRGVCRDTEAYQRGDCVTDHGSLWFCQTETRTRPGQSKDWRLAAKSGQVRS